MKSDSLYLMDQKQYNFIEAKERESEREWKIKLKERREKHIIPFLLASFVFVFSLFFCSSEVSPLCPIHLLLFVLHFSALAPFFLVCSIFQLTLYRLFPFFLSLFDSFKGNVCLTSTTTTTTATTIVSHLKLFLFLCSGNNGAPYSSNGNGWHTF